MEHICIYNIRTYLRFEIESFQDDEMHGDTFPLILFTLREFFLFFFWQKKNCVEILKRTHLRVKLTFSDRFRERCEPSTLQNCQSIAAM